jgi:glycosyltransferase involved in cell wall biosynthesis
VKISIITPSFNQKGHLGATLQSVLNQEIRDLEYIVIDGGSTDGSSEIIREISPRLAYWCSETDGGQYQAINKGFEKSTGEIMGWLNSSDLYLPWTLKTVEDIFTRFPEVQWISSMRKVCIMEDGSFEWMDEMPGFSGRRLAKGLHGGPGNGDYIQQETCFWRRGLWEKIGGKITDEYRYAGDFWLWSEFFKHARCTGVEAPLAAFRFHGLQRSGEGSYHEEVRRILQNLSSTESRKTLLSGYQNIVRRWVPSPGGAGGHSELRLVKYYDDRFYALIKFFTDFFRKARWTASSILFFPIAAWHFAKRGFRRLED